jgi:hypothetical protein
LLYGGDVMIQLTDSSSSDFNPSMQSVLIII